MNANAQPPVEDFHKAVAYALGYLMAAAALPMLAWSLPWRQSARVGVMLVLTVLLLRLFQGMVVRGTLSPLRAKAVLLRVDLASLFVFTASACIAWELGPGGSAPFQALLTVWAVAALSCAVAMLQQARQKWFSLTFLSQQDQ